MSMEVVWFPVIAYKYKLNCIKIISFFKIEVIPPLISEYLIFNEGILDNILNRRALAYSNAPVNAGIIEGFWIISDITKEYEMKYRMYFKTWSLNTPKGTEVTTLLDLIEIVYRKLRHLTSRRIQIFHNNKDVVRGVNHKLITENKLVQDTGSKIA